MRRSLTSPILLMTLVLLLSACSPKVSSPSQNPIQATATATTYPGAPKSDDLINDALSKGEIDPQTALMYKVYAQFSDPRLPAAFKGSADLHTDSHIIDQLQADFPTLSPETQAAMLPFLMPPSYQGAWGPPAEGSNGAVQQINLLCSKIETDKWDSTSAMHSPVRFWWLKSRPEDAAIANRFMTAMDDEIWPKLTGLMGRVPLPDQDAQCNGGGSTFDIYITPQIARSYAAAYFPPGCRETPSYIVMNPATTDGILAHEFMHAIQWSYNTAADCMYPGEYAWLAEATASWAQDYVYPDTNEEHRYIPWFYDGGTAGQPPVLTIKNDAHEYGALLFFFYLTHHFDQPGLVKTAWDNTLSMKSVDAVDRAIPGGLDAVWGDFAIDNVVEPPRDDYQVWDQLNVKPGGTSLTSYAANPTNTYKVTENIDHLSIQYAWFTFSENARLVTYFNGLTYQLDDEPINTYMGVLPIKDGTTQFKFTAMSPEDVKGVKIQAYFKIAGDTSWQVEDWTDKPYMAFCRDAVDERLTDLVIVTSNSSPDNDVYVSGKYASNLYVSDVGCWRYGGTASMQSTGSGEGGSYTDQQTIANVAFERTESHPNIPYPYLHFSVVDGQMERAYQYQSTDGECSGSGEAHTALSQPGSSGYANDLFVLYGATSGPSAFRYSGEANANQSLQVDFQCPDGASQSAIPSLPWFYVDVLSQILPKVYTFGEDGILEGSDDLLQSVDAADMQYQWHFESLYQTASSGASQPDINAPTSVPHDSSSSGSASSTQSPSSTSLGDVPEYPHAESSQIEPVSGMLILTTQDSKETVAEFYRDQFTALGWQDGSTPAGTTEDMITLMFAKDSKMVTIMISSSDGVTQIVINEFGG
jgi:hypothetical protein